MKVQRLRVTFARGELLRYITHLDVMRSWERALKRAGLPLAYSEGFTRHAQIALAAPLPVGATAEGELMDVFLEAPVAVADFRARLAAQTPPGLTIEAVEEAPLAAPSLQSLVKEWTWLAQLPAETGFDAARRSVSAFMGSDTFPWEQQRDKEVRRYDLRTLVLEARVEESGDGPLLWARFKAEAGGRPEQLAAALGFDPRRIRIHRLSLGLDAALGVP